jgi:hypothetical protein
MLEKRHPFLVFVGSLAEALHLLQLLQFPTNRDAQVIHHHYTPMHELKSVFYPKSKTKHTFA